MTKVNLNDLVNLQNETTAVNTINVNNAVIETAFDNTLSRDGTSPNTMSYNLDMNSNQIINLPAPVSSNSPARLVDIISNPTLVLTIPPVGTSGATVPLLNTVNTWSANQIFRGHNINLDTGAGVTPGGTAGFGILFSAASSNFGIFYGSGAPTLSAYRGSLYLRIDGGSTTTRMYVNADGGTTWTGVTTTI